MDAATESNLCSFVESKILDVKFVEEKGKGFLHHIVKQIGCLCTACMHVFECVSMNVSIIYCPLLYCVEDRKYMYVSAGYLWIFYTR